MSKLIKNRENIKILILVYSLCSLATSCTCLYFIPDWWCRVFGIDCKDTQKFALINDCVENVFNRTETLPTNQSDVSCVDQHQLDYEQNIRNTIFVFAWITISCISICECLTEIFCIKCNANYVQTLQTAFEKEVDVEKGQESESPMLLQSV